LDKLIADETEAAMKEMLQQMKAIFSSVLEGAYPATYPSPVPKSIDAMVALVDRNIEKEKEEENKKLLADLKAILAEVKNFKPEEKGEGEKNLNIDELVEKVTGKVIEEVTKLLPKTEVLSEEAKKSVVDRTEEVKSEVKKISDEMSKKFSDLANEVSLLMKGISGSSKSLKDEPSDKDGGVFKGVFLGK